MRVFNGSIKTDKQGSDCEFTFEVEDAISTEQIYEEAREAAFNCIEWHYKEVGEGKSAVSEASLPELPSEFDASQQFDSARQAVV